MRFAGFMVAMTVMLAAVPADAAQDRKTPYWASISASEALMRTGPGRNYPAVWHYRRPDLPILVVKVHQNWRKVRDPDGTEGWMDAVLLSAARTAMVRGGIASLRDEPDPGSRLLWRVAPGVVGKIRHCERGWCELNVKGKSGYVETSALWGVGRHEVID